MEKIHWKTVLIDWINCLKLHEPIQSLEELKNGEFIRNLRKLIKKATGPIPDDDLTVIFKLLSKHYPLIKFENRESIHINDMPQHELTNLTSLLMHYTCIFDRRSEFTSPMCYSLNMPTQVHIRKFLIFVSSETTNQDLDDFIQNISSDGKALINNTPVGKKSPLLELLTTPVSKKARLVEKEREIEMLKLSFESNKAESEVEIMQLQETVYKLENLLKQKSLEIARLRQEIETLEPHTPQKPKDAHLEESLKLLRMEVQQLEQYVQKCNQENEELEAEQKKLKETLEISSQDCKKWQEGYAGLEEKLQLIAANSVDLEQKNENLEQYCTELQSLLDEYRTSGNHDDSYTYLKRRSDSFEPQEDLAHSVVDVQLKESEKRVEYLREELRISEESNRGLIEAVEGLKIEVQKKSEDLKKLQVSIETVLEDKKCEVERLGKENYVICQEKLEICCKLEESVRKLQKSEEKIKGIEEELKQTQEQKTHFSNLVKDLNLKLEDSKVKMQKLSSEMKQLEQDFQQQRIMMEKSLDRTVKKLEASEVHLHLKTEELQKSQEAKILVQNFLDLNCNELLKVTQEKEWLLEALEMANNDRMEVEEEVEELRSKVEIHNWERQMEERREEQLMEQIQIMEDLHRRVIKEKERLWLELQSQVTELGKANLLLGKMSKDKEKKIEELQLQNRELEVVNKEQQESLYSVNAAYKKQGNSIKILEEKLNDSIKTKLKLLNEIGQLQVSLNVTEEERAIFIQIIKETTVKLEAAEEKIEAPDAKLNLSGEELQGALAAIALVKNSLDLTRSNFLKVSNENEQLIDALAKANKGKENLEEKLKDFNNATQKLSNEMKQLQKHLEVTEEERVILTKSLKESTMKLEATDENLKLSEHELQKALEKISSVQNDLDLTQSDFHKVLQEKEELIELLKKSNKDKENLGEKLEDFNNERQKLSNEMEQLQLCFDATEKERLFLAQSLNDTVANLEATQKNLEETQSKLEVMDTKLKLKGDELKKSQEATILVQNLLDLNRCELEKSTHQKKQLLEALETYNEDRFKLEEEAKKLQLKVEMQCIENEANLQKTTKEKEVLIREIREVSSTLEEVRKEKEGLSEQLEKLKKEHQEVLSCLVITKREKENLERQLEDSTILKEKLCNEIEHVQNNLKAAKEHIVELQKTIQDNEEINAALQIQRNLNSEFEQKHQDSIAREQNLRQEIERLQYTIENNLTLIKTLQQEVKDLLLQLEASPTKTEILKNLQNTIKEKEELFSELEKVSIKLEATKKQNLELQQGRTNNESEIKKLQLENNEVYETLSKEHQEALANLEAAWKEQKALENEYKKILLEKEDISKEKNDIYDFLQRSVEEKEKAILERDRLKSENEVLVKDRDAMLERFQVATENNQKLQLSLEVSQKETLKIKNERNEILQSQTKIMKETETNILRAHEAAVDERRALTAKIEIAEKERDKVRQAYASVILSNSKLELENSSLRHALEKGSQESGEIKEAYEKLLGENCKRVEEVQMLKQKRARDREEFLMLLKREQEKVKRVEQVRSEYEEKLDKMKDKMLKLYREEVQKEVAKLKGEQAGEVAYLHKMNDNLRSELYESEQKFRLLETQRNPPKGSDFFGRELARGKGNKVADRNSVMSSCGSLVSREKDLQQIQKVRSLSQLYGKESTATRKMSTLPPRLQNDFKEENVITSGRTSINSIGRNFEMEDEVDDMFNNKYLTDLKEGRCQSLTGRESHVSRMSELAWRNSMVPPHLKSSYPAEVQFVSPTRFKDDDIKMGQIDLDDSQCRLLAGDKPRPKKDFGTTSYKKPGPPTPSKSGGRQSLQGNELQPLREQNFSTPKKTTPGRIKALFKGIREGGTSTRENSENASPKKRLSIFRNRR